MKKYASLANALEHLELKQVQMRSLGERPIWIPERVWAAWLVTMSDGGNFSASKKAIADSDCGCVWQALDKRLDDPEDLCDFFYAIEGACNSNNIFAESPVKRKKGAAKISNAASQLLELMTSNAIKTNSRLKSPNFFISHIEGGIMDAVEKILNSQSENEEHNRFVRGAAMEISLNFSEILRAIQAAASETSALKPITTEGSSNPARLQFIRLMTESFREKIGQPMRKQVAALTGCLFDCYMDASTVAKLAP